MTNPAALQKFHTTKVDNLIDNQSIKAGFLAPVKGSKHLINGLYCCFLLLKIPKLNTGLNQNNIKFVIINYYQNINHGKQCN